VASDASLAESEREYGPCGVAASSTLNERRRCRRALYA